MDNEIILDHELCKMRIGVFFFKQYKSLWIVRRCRQLIIACSDNNIQMKVCALCEMILFKWFD